MDGFIYFTRKKLLTDYLYAFRRKIKQNIFFIEIFLLFLNVTYLLHSSTPLNCMRKVKT